MICFIVAPSSDLFHCIPVEQFILFVGELIILYGGGLFLNMVSLLIEGL
jgi:hypothetical protein